MARVAVVTGGRSGIGEAVTRTFLGQGLRVATFDILPEDALDYGRAVGAPAGGPGAGWPCAGSGAPYRGLKVDVTDPDAVRKAVGEIASAWGTVDILVNCAGVLGPETPFLDTTTELWTRVLAVNLLGTVNCLQACLPHMIKSGWGRVVNFSSTAARRGTPGLAPYASAKAAILALTTSVACEVGRFGVTVNSVAPGLIRTAMSAERIRLHGDKLMASIPLGRAGEPADVADVVAFLVSDAARYVTGQCVNINGGMLTAL